MKKRVCGALLALALALGILPGGALAKETSEEAGEADSAEYYTLRGAKAGAPALLAEPISGTWEGDEYYDEETGEYKRGGGTWTLDAAGTLTIEGTGKPPWDLYKEWDAYKDSVRCFTVRSGITSIPGDWFYDWGDGVSRCKSLKEVLLPDSVSNIYAGAFSGCTALTSVTLGAGLTSIGDSAFNGCTALTSVTLPAGLTSIGDSAFSGCTALTSVTFGAGLTSIGDSAFEGTCLESLTLPAGLTEIGKDAFAKCDQLDSIAVAAGNAAFKAVDGVVFSADGKTLALYPSGRRGAYAVPEGTEKIGDYAFSGARGLTKVTFPAGVREIGRYAFNGCDGLRELAFPAGMAGLGAIQDHAFSGCYGLTELVLPEGLKTLENSAFSNCDGLTAVALPGSLEAIGKSAFSDCDRLASVKFSQGLKTLGNSAFSWCDALREAALPEGLESVGDSAFEWCGSLKKAALPGSLTRLGENAFQYCDALTDLTLGEGITRIENRAFGGCSRIQRLMLPKSLTYIGSDVFTSAKEADIHFAGTEEEWKAVRQGYNALPEGLRVRCGSTGPVEPDLDEARRNGWPFYDWESESTVWNLSLTIDNGGRAGNAAVRAALYDENGRFLGLQEQTLPLEEGEKTYDLSLTFSGVERGSVGGKVFLSDAAARPLFPAL